MYCFLLNANVSVTFLTVLIVCHCWDIDDLLPTKSVILQGQRAIRHPSCYSSFFSEVAPCEVLVRHHLRDKIGWRGWEAGFIRPIGGRNLVHKSVPWLWWSGVGRTWGGDRSALVSSCLCPCFSRQPTLLLQVFKRLFATGVWHACVRKAGHSLSSVVAPCP